MKNFVMTGDTLTLAAPYDVAPGAGALVGSVFGVAQNTVANGVDGEFKLNGVFDLKFKATDTPAQGAKVYWDNTNKECTTTVGSNTLIGSAVLAKTNGPVVGRVRLNGTVS